MRITSQQQGPIAQNEFAKFAMIGSDGEVELSPALTDDEGRDFEVHRRKHYGRGISIQVKSVLSLKPNHRKLNTLRLGIGIPKAQLGGHRGLWFFIAYLHPRRMEFVGPCFLVPSSVLYRQAPHYPQGKKDMYEFVASMEPASNDKWSGYRVEPLDIGQRLLEVLRDAKGETARVAV